MGPNNLKISVFMVIHACCLSRSKTDVCSGLVQPKINAEKAVVYVKGTTFHCSTLSQSPKYYVTKDLTSVLKGVRLDDEKAVASYERGFLNVVVPLIGSREAIDAARRWAEPEEMQKRLASKAIAKRKREEELAAQQLVQSQGGGASKSKKKKKNKKQKQGEGGPQATTNSVSALEGSLTERIASEAGVLSEKKVEAAVKKNQAKEAWLQSVDAKTQQKRRKRKGLTDDLRESVKQQVEAQFSNEGKKKAQKEKKLRKKQKSEALANVKEKKSVKFASQ